VTQNGLRREESALGISLAWTPVREYRTQWRIAFGPSFFWVKANLVREVLYTQTSGSLTPQNTVTVDDAATAETKGTGFGVHLAGEFSYYFTKIVGVGGGVRLSTGSVSVDKEPLTRLGQDVRVGGALVFFGARLRLGG